MTPERIAEIDKAGSLFVDNGEREDSAALEELCRLARLGLRVEGAPTRLALFEGTGLPDYPFSCRIHNRVPDEWEGKRVALVVLEDSE